jgi:hypothetical protein
MWPPSGIMVFTVTGEGIATITGFPCPAGSEDPASSPPASNSSVGVYGGVLASPGALCDEGQGRACQHGQAAEHVEIAFEEADEPGRMTGPGERDAPGEDRGGRQGGQAASG